MKKKVWIGSLIFLTAIISGCSSSNKATTQSSKTTKETIASTTNSSTSNSTEKSSSTSDKEKLEESSDSSVATESMDANNNIEKVSYDDATKTLTTPISTIKIEEATFDSWKRGSAVSPIFILRYSVTNTSDEIFNSANHGSLPYVSVVAEKAGKRFSSLPTRPLSIETDPYHTEYKNYDRRLEQGDTVTLATAYAFPDETNTIYIEFYDTSNKPIKRLEITVSK